MIDERKLDTAANPAGLNECAQRQAISPDTFDLTNSLVELYARGEYTEVLTRSEALLAVEPNHTFLLNLAAASAKAIGDSPKAEKYWRLAIQFKPDYAEAHNNLGVLFKQLNRYTEAERAYLDALQFKAGFAEAHNNLGNLYCQLKRHSEAEIAFRRALAINPDYADAYFNLGNLLRLLQRRSESESAYRMALRLSPDYAEALNNLGMLLEELQRWKEAEVAYREALSYRPDYADAFNNLGVLLKRQNKTDEAESLFRKALSIKPEFAEAHSNLAMILYEDGRRAEAEQVLTECLDYSPHHADAMLYRVLHCLPIVPGDCTEADRGVNAFDSFLLAWSKTIRNLGFRKTDAEAVGRRTAFYLAYRRGNHKERLSRFGDVTSRLMSEHWPIAPSVLRSGPLPFLRLAIISAYVRRQSVWDILLHGLLGHLDRRRFDTILIHTCVAEEDAVTEHAKTLVTRYYGHCGDLEHCLRIIGEEAPHIIFYPEIGMDPVTNKLANLRLAPLQVASWGHPITTGLPTIDLYFSGMLIEGEGAQAHYWEKLIRLPGTGVCTVPPPDVAGPLPTSLRELLAESEGPRFVLCQAPFKFDPADDELYPQIARQVGRCRFYLLVFSHQGKLLPDRLLGRLKNAFERYRLKPEEYLRIVPALPVAQFYSFLDQMDVYLDCPAFSGYTTAWQAVHRGIPIVTLEGEFMRQRLAAGVLRQIGKMDTIAATPGEYIDIAVSLAIESVDQIKKESRRQAIRAAAPKLDNNTDVVRMFEQSLIGEMVQRGFLLQNTNSAGAVSQEEDMPSDSSGNLPKVKKKDMPSLYGEDENTGQPLLFPVWRQLERDLHMQTLKQDYAPIGLLEMIPEAKRILDVGCFCGGTGRWLRAKFPDCIVTGIEMLGKAAEIAAPFYDRMIVSRFEGLDFEDNRLGAASFDTIITADVLEHMVNPWKTLQRLKPLLSADGVLYASIPNVRNLNVVMNLGKGLWPYEGAGIQDVSHLRFFTRASLVQMFNETGWVIDEIRLNLDPGLTTQFEGKDPSLINTIDTGNMVLKDLSRDDLLEFLTLQFFVRARPKTG